MVILKNQLRFSPLDQIKERDNACAKIFYFS